MNYLEKDNKLLMHKPWLGDVFSSFYDSIMEKSIFPKKFEASIENHRKYLRDCYSSINNLSVLELAAGSGDLARLLPTNNNYIGIDISKGLLKIAYRKFIKNNFKNVELYICSADELPFTDNYFNVCICNLSFNFFAKIETVVEEIYRVLETNGMFYCSVPVPERNVKKITIRGSLHSEEMLKTLFEKNGFKYESFSFTNGAVLYFKADKIG